MTLWVLGKEEFGQSYACKGDQKRIDRVAVLDLILQMTPKQIAANVIVGHTFHGPFH